jgi:hypothetical protein
MRSRVELRCIATAKAAAMAFPVLATRPADGPAHRRPLERWMWVSPRQTSPAKPASPAKPGRTTR